MMSAGSVIESSTVKVLLPAGMSIPAPKPNSAGPCTAIKRCSADRSHAAKARVPVLPVPFPERSRGVEGVENVVHHLARAGTKLNRAHPFVFGEAGGDHEIAVNIGTARRQIVAHRHFKNQVRLSQVPTVGELRQLGSLGWV